MDDDRLIRTAALPAAPVVGQFLRFCTVGAINTVVDFGVYIGLTRPFAFWAEHYVAASAVSFCVAVTSSFLLNNFWTFGRQGVEWRRGAKFYLVATGGLCLNAATLYALTRLGMYDLLAKAVATGLVLAWNFTLQRKWTFKA
jgi:putative flippase GtrA